MRAPCEAELSSLECARSVSMSSRTTRLPLSASPGRQERDGPPCAPRRARAGDRALAPRRRCAWSRRCRGHLGWTLLHGRRWLRRRLAFLEVLAASCAGAGVVGRAIPALLSLRDGVLGSFGEWSPS